MCLYVRPLSTEEGQTLLRLVRKSPDVTTFRRAQVILSSSQGMPVSEIVTLYHFNDQYVRTIIRNFNDHGMEAVKRKKPPDRPMSITKEERVVIVELALIPPCVLGLPFAK